MDLKNKLKQKKKQKKEEAWHRDTWSMQIAEMGLKPADPPEQLTPPFVGLFANIHIILLLVD